jgi:ribosome-associated translation inhibitor RaiA
MQTPPELVFEGATATPDVKQAIEKHIAELEHLYGRITACRVAVKAPSQHQHKGGLYEVHIRLLLPDQHEVNVERTTTADERFADLNFALNDAFKRARRQLEDHRHRGETEAKETERIPKGKGRVV